MILVLEGNEIRHVYSVCHLNPECCIMCFNYFTSLIILNIKYITHSIYSIFENPSI